MRVDDVKLLYAYGNWATRRMLAMCEQVSAEQYAAVQGQQSLRTTLVHLLDAQWSWREGYRQGFFSAERVKSGTHLAEVRAWDSPEITEAHIRWGTNTLGRANLYGLLDLELIAAHCVWLNEVDIALMGHRHVNVAHNPVANMILASGVCPVPRLRAAGIAVGIGTDGAASNDSQNMLEAIKCTGLLHKLSALDPRAIRATDVLRMATIEGARACGRWPRGSRRPSSHRDREQPATALIEERLAVLAPESAATGLAVGIVGQLDRRTLAIGRNRPHVVHATVVVREPDMTAIGRPLVSRRVLDLHQIIDGEFGCGSLGSGCCDRGRQAERGD